MESVMKILRVQTSPRGENSESRKLGDHLIAKAKRIDPTSATILRDVSTGVALPDLTWIGANFTDADKRDANQVRALRRVRSAMARASRKHVRRQNDF